MSVYIYKLSQWVEKWFNAKGGNVITDLDPAARVVLPALIGVEQRYLQGWNRYAIAANVPAVAAQFSRCRIRNPVGSNVILVLEQLVYLTFTASTTDTPLVTWGTNTTDLASIVSLSFSRMDPRGNPQPTAIVSFNQQASGGTPFLQRACTQFVPVDFINNPNQEIPVLPGNSVDLQANVVNAGIVGTFMWRERALETSELT